MIETETQKIIKHFEEQEESLFEDIDLVAGSIARGSCTKTFVNKKWNTIFPPSYNKDAIHKRLNHQIALCNHKT